jgi:predicted adenylyl cyclase CyaB
LPNIEIKAAYSDLRRARAIAERIGARFVGRDHQVDTYFAVPRGRLKLRESSLSGAMLIPYLRADVRGPKKSEYSLLPVNDAARVKGLFDALLGVEAVVVKDRDIYLVDNVRVHLDEVKGQGSFFELEAVYADGADVEREEEKVRALLIEFEVKDRDLVEGSYREKLKGKPASEPGIHELASLGFDRAVEAYERSRPEYPEAAVQWLADRLEIRPGRTIIDLGAGTGKFTRLLAKTGARIIAVEPVAGMRAKFQRLLPTIDILEGTAENMPLPDGGADAVVVAQAFHWFNGERALAEIRRVLRPGGSLGLIWNARDESVNWVARLTRIIDPHDRGAPRYRSMEWREAFASSLDSESFRHVHFTTPEGVVDRVVSISFIAALPAPERERVAEEVRELLRTHPQTQNRETIEFPYRTDVYFYRVFS